MTTHSPIARLPKASQEAVQRLRRGIGRHVAFGAIAFFAIVVGLGGMAQTIDIAGAVVTQGRLVVGSNVKKVQHTTGGAISEIAVKDGDRVKAGQVIIRLDSTLAAANLAIIARGLDEIAVRKVRLDAERDGLPVLVFPPEIKARATDPQIKQQIAIETVQFESRLAARDGQKGQLAKKIAELGHQAEGIAAQRAAGERQAELTRKELEGLTALAAKTLVPADRLSAVGRQAAQYEGQLGGLIAQEGQIGAETAQTQLQILQIDQDMHSEVAKQAGDDESKFNELSERLIAAQDQLHKLEIRAPQDGTVYQLAVHTVGGVIGPGETIMMIVPDNDVLVVEARVDPNDVDRMHPGSDAGLHFTSFGSRTTPQFIGKLLSISPDLMVDERSGASYFLARIALPDDAIAALGKTLVPGMPVEVFVATGDRTVLSYLTKPLTDQIRHAFRER